MPASLDKCCFCFYLELCPRGGGASNWYRYDEITLANGKRLDSYNPPDPKRGKRGEIVSRKATTLEDIEIETFESYLKEMKLKYSPGEKINAPKYGSDLEGQVLDGDMYLEIPDTNKQFNQISAYEDLASTKYNITLRYKAEK
jgi:hypothetical protein